MGIVPENEYLLGLEGAGVVRRLGKQTRSVSIGQRVLVYDKGTFANRVQTTSERVYPLPDSMSFEVRQSIQATLITAAEKTSGSCYATERVSCVALWSLPHGEACKGPGDYIAFPSSIFF